MTRDVFQAVSDPTRRAILDRLRSGGAPVAEIAAGFRMSRPAVSKHLRVLRQARLVREQRSGRQRIYRLEPAPLEGVLKWIESYRVFWQQALMNLKRHLERASGGEGDATPERGAAERPGSAEPTRASERRRGDE